MPFVHDFAEKIRQSIDGETPWAAYCKHNCDTEIDADQAKNLFTKKTWQKNYLNA